MANRQIKGIKVNGEFFDVNLVDIVSHFTAPNGMDYIVKVDNEGHLYTERADGGDTPVTSATRADSFMPAGDASLVSFGGESKLYINEIYCGGEDATENSLNYASHNFVELSNLTKYDLELEGCSLQYTKNGKDWKVLPLRGVIKSGSTFLIRGAQCSNLNSPTTKIHVDTFDMEWRVGEDLIKFSTESAKFYLRIGTDQYTSENPYSNGAVNTDAFGYIDVVGIQRGSNNPGGYEKGPYKNGGGLSNTRLFKKYYAMDPVKQATKAIDKRNNANDWNFVDLTKEDGEVIPSIEVFTPRASYENKNIFYNKTNLDNERPSMITCTFGIQATAGSNGATRCFNWVTGRMSEKYIWIKPKASSDWGVAHETFYAEDGRTAWNHDFYNQIIKEYSNKTVIIVNKFIMSGLTAGQYEYVAGRKNSDGTPDLAHCTDVRSFTVRNTNDCGSFKFVQTSDQQGFNWDEYRVWNAASKTIMKENPTGLDFMINTGDMTQNGNRLGEWLDYFGAKCPEMNNLEEMATIGNNDLSLNDLAKIARGEDYEKLWLENLNFFYTFEYDESNLPVFKGEDGVTDYFIPSLYSFNYGKVHFLCMNTEIKASGETSDDGYAFDRSGVFYPQIKQWCENDIAANESGKDWLLAYCHEMPFTILTPDAIHPRSTKRKTARTGGCNANENVPANLKYWFGEFCQTHNIPLVFGGHKHTQATSYPLIENVTYDASGENRTVNSMTPIIVVDSNSLKEFDNSTELVPAEGTTSYGFAYSGRYPNGWFESGVLKGSRENEATLATFMMASEVAGITRPDGKTTKPVVYAMSQATGYKHTSNKELPSPNLPWLRYYFPCSVDGGDTPTQKQLENPTANAAQKFPFYTVWEVSANQIVGNVRKVYGAFNDGGKFDINVDGAYTKNGYCATTAGATDSVGGHSDQMFSINGLTSMTNVEARDSEEVIRITK